MFFIYSIASCFEFYKCKHSINQADIQDINGSICMLLDFILNYTLTIIERFFINW